MAKTVGEKIMGISKDAREGCIRLVNLFIKETQKHFYFLVKDYKFKVECGLLDLNEEDILIDPKDYHFEAAWFFARVIYKKRDKVITVKYGDRDFFINTLLIRKHPKTGKMVEYGILEYLAALKIPYSEAVSDNLVFTRKQMTQILASRAKELKSNFSKILRAGPEVFKLMDADRRKRERDFEREFL